MVLDGDAERAMKVEILALATALVACGGPPPAPTAVDTAAPITFTGEPALFARGVVSSEYSEVRLAMSPGGERVLWGSRDRPGPGGKNVWMSRRTADGWSAPEAAPFNSDADDYDPAFSPDGAHVYFFSTRPGGAGGADLYRVPVTGEGFGAALHLGPEVNTAGDEWAPTPSPDGTQLLFASNTPGGKHDLYVARIAGAGFEQARLLPGALNEPDADELDPTFLADGTSIVYSRAPDIRTQPVQLYLSTLGSDGYRPGRLLPPTVNIPGDDTYAPAVSAAEPRTLYFSSRRPDGVGDLDVFRIEYTLR
jgi:TolB protein